MSNRDDSSGDRNEAHDDEESGVDSERDSSPDSEDSRPSAEERPRRAKAKGKRARESVKAPAKPSGSNNLVLAAVVALAVGGAGGWFGHDAQVKAKARAADSAPAAAGSAGATGPCATWEKKVCSGTGDQSAACAQAKAATGLLTPSMCDVALAGIPATLAKVKAERAPCDKLVAKLCGDLPPGSQACDLVKERTPSFPSERCTQMLEHYDDVIGQLKQLDQQGMPGMQPGMPPGAMPHGMPPGAMPHGMPPGAAPGALPQGMPPGAVPHAAAPAAPAHP